MLHLEAKWPSKQHIKLQTKFWQNQIHSQVLRFGGPKSITGRKYFCSYHMFKTMFSEDNKIWGGTKKIWW